MTATHTIPAKIVRRDNMVLRDLQIVTMTSRAKNETDYALVEVGIKAGDRFEVLGTYSQQTTALEEGVPRSIIAGGANNRRLRNGQAIVVRVTTEGDTGTLVGTCVDLLFALIGGAVGPERPLVSVGTAMQDPRARIALESAVAQVNTVGLAEITTTVLLRDPSDPRILAATGESSSLASSTTETTMLSATIPGGTLLTDRAVYVWMHGTYLNNTNANQTLTLRITFGGTSVYGDVSATIASSVSSRPWCLRFMLSALGGSQAQSAYGMLEMGAPGGAATAGIGDLAAANVLAASLGRSSVSVNAALDQALAVRFTHSASDASLSITRLYASVEAR